MIRIEDQNNQPLNDAVMLASEAITGNQSPENAGVQNEESVPSEQPQSSISASDPGAPVPNDQSTNEKFALDGGETIAYEQSTDDPSVGDEGALNADEPFGTANVPIEDAAVDNNYIASSNPSDNCDTNDQQSFQTRKQNGGRCDVRPMIDTEDSGQSGTDQKTVPQPRVELHKIPVLGPHSPGGNDCARYTLGFAPIAVCAPADEGTRHISTFTARGVQFWRLKEADLGMFCLISSMINPSRNYPSVLRAQIKSQPERMK